MASPTQLVLLVTIALCAVQLIGGYSFQNCIADPNSQGKSFKCVNRKNVSISEIIEDLPLSAVNLTISFNPVSCIPNNTFAHLPNIQNLIMAQNKLNVTHQLAFQNLNKLESLDLSVNKLSQLSPALFEDLINLKFLSLTSNKLQELPESIFSSVLNLERLLLRNNLLTDFSGIVRTVSHLMNLTMLDLGFNNLTSLSHSNASLPTSLSVLYLCTNNLHTLGCAPSFLRFVKMLDFSYNRNISAAAFQGVDLSHVRWMRLHSTRINVVELLKISNINASHVDFSGTGLKNESLLVAFCTFLKRKLRRMNNVLLVDNGIRNLTKSSLHHCPAITGQLDLSRNHLKKIKCLEFLSEHTRNLTVEHNLLTALPNCKTVNVYFKRLVELSYRYNRILTVCSYAFYHTPNIKVLKLNINNIAFLDHKALKGLKRLETLRLDNNLLTDLYRDTFEDNINLKILNLRNNRISVIFKCTFINLRNLTTLDLGGNKITQIMPSGFDGLKSLSKLYLDGNNLKMTDTSYYHVFQDTLTVLDLRSNKIRFIKNIIDSPFANLSKLRDLKLDSQRPHGLTLIPRNLFRGLHSLRSLYLTNNNIFHLGPEIFDDLINLHFLTLDNCCVGVAHLQPGVFKNLGNLSKLIVENMGIQNFSKEVFGSLSKLSILQLNRNVLQSIPVDALESLPKLRYLDIRNIPLSCTCKNSLLQNYSVNHPDVQVVYLHSLKCPLDRNQSFYNFDTKVCYIDLGEYLFFTTAAVIFLFTVTPLLYVKLYWKIKYGFYVFRAWFSEQWSRIREKEEKCIYDAFVSYNSSDEDWVMDELLPNLEGNGSSFKLCLHHRDFELGRDIVDNIVNAVYSSRKTICVVSRSFLQSEWCSLEIQLASYRLFDEHRDVLLLVFLEPVSERQLSPYHRMRKVMLKKTYLQWPGQDCINPLQAQELFWSQLRRAVGAGSRVVTHEGAAAESVENKDFENHFDEKSHLLP
ncbi:toll-like receptor 21 [Menidia menidia]